jgi:hypothetical protein
MTKSRLTKPVGAQHPSEDFELQIIKSADHFTTFYRFEGRHKETWPTYKDAHQHAKKTETEHGLAGRNLQVLIYAVNAAGRQALVTKEMATKAGLTT